MQTAPTPQTDEQRRRNRIVIAITVIVMAVALYFVVPIAFQSGRNTIDTPAEAARKQ